MAKRLHRVMEEKCVIRRPAVPIACIYVSVRASVSLMHNAPSCIVRTFTNYQTRSFSQSLIDRSSIRLRDRSSPQLHKLCLAESGDFHPTVRSIFFLSSEGGKDDYHFSIFEKTGST